MSKKLHKKYIGDLYTAHTGGIAPLGDFGIETEIEGIHLGSPDGKYWGIKPEGSLRNNGMEYFCVKPVPLAKLDDALEEYQEALDKSKKLVPSLRCSTHIHVNVSKLQVEELYRVLCVYFLVEELLVKTQGPLRQGNLFCLRMSDAEGISKGLCDSIRRKTYFGSFGMGQYKYGAVNLSAPYRFGSLEFRFFRPLLDTTSLKFWCVLLHDLVHKAKNIPAEKIVSSVMELSPKAFMAQVWDVLQIEKLTENVPYWELQELLATNYDHVAKIQYLLDNDKYWKISSNYPVMSDDVLLPDDLILDTEGPML